MSQVLRGEPLRVRQEGAQGDQDDACPNDANKVLKVHLAGLSLFWTNLGRKCAQEVGIRNESSRGVSGRV